MSISEFEQGVRVFPGKIFFLVYRQFPDGIDKKEKQASYHASANKIIKENWKIWRKIQIES